MSQHVRVERVSDVLQQAAQAQLLLAALRNESLAVIARATGQYVLAPLCCCYCFLLVPYTASSVRVVRAFSGARFSYILFTVLPITRGLCVRR